ncbi:MAG: phosphatase PAP2 family protein [bacterium]
MFELDSYILVLLNKLAISSDFLKSGFVFLAEYLIYLVPLVLIILWFYSPKSKKVALTSFFSGTIALGAGLLLSSEIKRARPFDGLGIQEVLFHRPDYSFPSHHAILLFACAFALWFCGYKKLGKWMIIMAGIITISRVAVGVHYPSDIIIGGLLGFIVAWSIYRLDPLLDRFYLLFLGLAKKLKLSWSYLK